MQEEIYLRDYVKILLRRKWIVILVSIISVLTTALFTFVLAKPGLQPRVYEGMATIQNGFIQSPIIAKEEGFELIKTSAGELSERILFEDIPKTLFFKIKIKGENLDSIKETCEGLIKDYIDNGNNLYNNQYKIYIDKINVLVQRKQILEDNINELEDEISKFEKIKTKELTDLQRLDRMSGYRDRINNTRIQILDIGNSISDINLILAISRKFSIISSFNVNVLINVDDYSSVNKLNKKTKLLISAVLGLIGGVLLAFTIENWGMPKGESK